MSAPAPGAGMVTRRTRVAPTAPGARVDLEALLADGRPVILRGLARDWPLAQAGLTGPHEAVAYLKGFDAGRPVVGYTGAPEIGGRYFYRDDLQTLNFAAERVSLSAYLDLALSLIGAEKPPSLYIGSTDLDLYLPGLGRENGLVLPLTTDEDRPPPIVSIWMGNRTTAATHFDMSNNLACCLVGRRRFTLFPPDQIDNLYPGPMEPTPGGQVVSLVDPSAPDLDRFPRFAQAAEAGEVAELEPGDVLFYPALWWHNVEALDDFNAMINYWWNDAPAFMDTPMTTLLHGLLSLRGRTAAEKAAWRSLFDFYVFGDAEKAAGHLPDAAQGDLAPLDERSARRLRALVLQKLNR